MSFDIVKTINFPQAAFQFVPQEIIGENAFEDFPIKGGILSDLKHIWHAKGPSLEVRNIASGRKVGSWTFGGILKDSNTKIIAIDELKRPHGRLSLLVIALECTISGGLVCVFDIFGSKVLRVVQVKEQITSLHVVDSGCENSVLPKPSPLRYFDGIIAIGSLGGNVYLLDICREICENGIENVDSTIRDELNPCQMVIFKKEKILNLQKYVDRSVEREEHLAIHINVVLNPSTEHFTLKGDNGEDRVHVNRSETEVSSLFYSPQIASLLVGYNFGAFQLWDLRSLELVYTSPICEEHIPVMHFTVQEPADDPKAYCYIWVSYSHNLMFHSGLPFAVMYSFYYENKNYVNGYGHLYEDFQHCSVRFQIELGDTETATYKSRAKGGTCIGLQSLNKYPINKDLNSLSLCLISWLIWNSQKEVSTAVLVFDLNQWYKEQMPREPNWSDCSNYFIKHGLSEQVLDVKLDQKAISQFIGIQRLDEHFCPTALSFDLWCITDDSILKVHNKGLQKAFVDKIVADQHLGLVRPEDYFEQITSLGLVPLFCEIHLNNSLDIDYQREILLNVALEQKLIGWLCQCTSKLANNAFNACGLTIYNVLNWAFERAITLKNSCDKYCVSLFDYSGTRLDSNTIALLNSSTNQIRNICSIYRYVSKKLMHFISDEKALLEEQRSLENVVVYFEVLLWMVNIGLLPEHQVKNYRCHDDSLMSAPYMVHDLTQYYNRKRAQLQMASHDTFVEKDCLLFVDNLINNRGGAEILRQQWQEDGGSGLYPPPSLQSVLRTYFLDGPDLVFKHSLVTYTLLDIAMTVDEDNKVIKLLLKFPQIFDLSQSNIKIVQAFWHLDHDDYETALDYILDPCVLTEDLQHWHHSVMMRSLLLQEKSSLALLYLQIRKPSVQDEKDLLTVISLLISKNMLDEAFKFRQQHEGPHEQQLLVHIFNECNKNELLHTLLYRRLQTDEERAFFKYLQGTKNPRCEDLKVFYYLLRSRFLEAFDSYSLTKRKKPENQGLIGQRDATTADNIVKMFKTLLPDVNKNLLELVRKERTNLWKEVPKPTPLSVFVHNARDQVRYKSSVIFAALSKAKQTFNDTLNGSRFNNDVVTEETPFLRTPTAFREVPRMRTPLMKSKVIEQNEQGEEYGPSPCKKLKLSPRSSKASPVKSRNLSSSIIQSKLSTPIIRRKRLSMELSSTTAVLPQSILKGGSVSRTILDDSIFDENTSVNTSLQLECENSVRRSRLALTPRKPVSRTPVKSHVKFDDLRYSGSSAEQTSPNDSTLHSLIPETSKRHSANSTASTVDELFYSPDNSPESSDDNDQKTTEDDIEEKLKNKSLSPVREKLDFEDSMVEDDVVKEKLQKNEGDAVKITVEDADLSTNRLTFQSPRSRRSYKRSFGESPIPVRSSPRLAKKASEEESETSTSSEPIINKSESSLKPSPSVAVQKLRGRKSLSRAVLENNAYSKLRTSSVVEEARNSGPKSSLSSANTTLNDTESDVAMNHSHNDSLEAFLNKYRKVASSANSSVNKNDSLLSDTGKPVHPSEEPEVVSKTTEVQSVEIRRENVRSGNTRELVSSKETREEYHSKTVEEFGGDEPQSSANVDTPTINVFKESEGIVEDDKKSEAGDGELSGIQEHESLNLDEVGRQNEEINIYEDLSSGSEDVEAVLKQFKKKEDVEKVYADISFSTSRSYYQSEKKELQMPENFMDSGRSNSNDDAPKLSPAAYICDNDVDMEELDTDDVPEAEKAFVNSEDVIEIGSSSDESSKSSSEDESFSSKDSVRGSNVSNESYNLNVEFERNLNEIADQSEENMEENQPTVDDLLGEDENSDGDDVFIEKQTNIPGQDKNVANDKETRAVPDEEKIADALEESSSSSDDISNPIEIQFESDQKEIADALKRLQEDTFTEDQEMLEADEEHMDSLILEEQSPEKELQDQPELKIVQFGDKSEASNKEPNGEVDIKELVVSHVNVSEEKGSLNVTDSQKPQSHDNMQLNTVRATPQDDEDKTKNLEEKGTSTSPVKQSRSLQCTLGVDDFKIESSVIDDTSVFLKEDEDTELQKNQQMPSIEIKIKELVEKATSTALDTPSRSLQVTLRDDDSVMEASMEEDTSTVPMEKSPKVEGSTPLVLRTVKKTYKGKRASETIDLDATPKLVVSLTKRTYSRKESGLGSKLLKTTPSNGDNSYAGTQERNIVLIEPDERKDETIKERIKEEEDSNESPSVPMDLEKPNRNLKELENKNQESVIKQTPDSTQDTPPKEQRFEKTPSPIKNAESTIGSTEASQGKDTSKAEQEQGTKQKPSMRVTRKRSMLLLSQQDGTPSSVSEESVSSSSGDTKRSGGNKEGSSGDLSVSERSTESQTSENPSESTGSQPSTSQSSTSRTTPSQTPRRVTRLSQASETLFDATLFVTDSSVLNTVDIMETTAIEGEIKVKVERDVLETDEEMDEANSSEAKPGPSKTRPSSKNGTRSDPSQKGGTQATVVAKPKRRTRSASVDQPSTNVSRKRSVRSKSIDLDDMRGSDTVGNTDLRVILTPIKEQAGTSTEKDVPEVEEQKHGTKAYSDVSAYTTSRRLTRRQASMLKTIGISEKEIKKLPSVAEIDPLHLMDKPEFAGKPDTEEANVYVPSSPSSSSGTPSRHTRSASVLSDAQSTPPKKKFKAKSEYVNSPVSGIKTRLRRQSADTQSVTSEQSDSPSPSKRSKKKDNESEAENDSHSVKSAKKGRSRANSVSSTKSAASDKTDTSGRATRSGRLHSAKTELPEIQEEKGGDEDESMDTSVVKPRGRKKKD